MLISLLSWDYLVNSFMISLGMIVYDYLWMKISLYANTNGRAFFISSNFGQYEYFKNSLRISFDDDRHSNKTSQ